MSEANQDGPVEPAQAGREVAPYVWRLDADEGERLFAALHGLTCSAEVADIPFVMEAVTDIFRPSMGGDGVRRRPLEAFEALAQSINDSEAVMAVFAAPEWDELSDDGRPWVCALVRETMARLADSKAAT
jgi:hypothetical protein